jgi:hypothetical protein
MRHRNYWVVVANVAILAVVTGCGDSITTPAAAPSSEPTTTMMAPASRPSLNLRGGSSENGSTDFTVGPQGGVFRVGNHAVVFPARSICDPKTSGYGHWDASCKAAAKPIRVHADIRSANGRTWVDFSPELRFVPSANPARWVWILMYTPDARGARGELSRFNILFADRIGGAMVNDAESDPTLRTYVDPWLGISSRRIKHFSGYTASGGRACESCGGSELQ